VKVACVLLFIFSIIEVCRTIPLLVGALLPFWLWQRRHPNSWVKYVSTPVLLTGITYISPAMGINYSSWFLAGFIFQFVIRRRNFAWWSKFNYITSAALDRGEWW
jgi:hypothetical protein